MAEKRDGAIRSLFESLLNLSEYHPDKLKNMKMLISEQEVI